MPGIPPIWFPPLSDRDAAVVAGFISHYRWGILNALGVLQEANPEIFPSWLQGNQRFFRDAEAYTRYQLYRLGYPIKKNQMPEGWNEPEPP